MTPTWYELALLILGALMVGGMFGWIVACLVRLGRGNDQVPTPPRKERNIG